MITQEIKRWLSKLFAWWHWRRSPEASYAQTLSNINPGVTQDSMARNMVDGPLPLTGSTSVAIEQGREEDISESLRLTTEERTDYVVPSHPLLAEETLHPPTKKKELSTTKASPPSPTTEQKLAFLQYLVKRGVFNEGFSEEQIPRQYKKSQR